MPQFPDLKGAVVSLADSTVGSRCRFAVAFAADAAALRGDASAAASMYGKLSSKLDPLREHYWGSLQAEQASLCE